MKIAITLMLLTSSLSFAGSWYRTDTELKIGDKHNLCIVKGQLDLGSRGSEPLRVAMGRVRCESALEVGEDKFVNAILNGETDIMNCLVCDQIVEE